MIPAIALDVGTVRIGVAVSDPSGTIALPMFNLDPLDSKKLWDEISRLVNQRHIKTIVVGWPKTLSGEDGESSLQAKAIADQAAEHTRLPVILWDERFSTAQAERDLIIQGVRRKQRREQRDIAAAALILQNWLDYQRNQV